MLRRRMNDFDDLAAAKCDLHQSPPIRTLYETVRPIATWREELMRPPDHLSERLHPIWREDPRVPSEATDPQPTHELSGLATLLHPSR